MNEQSTNNEQLKQILDDTNDDYYLKLHKNNPKDFSLYQCVIYLAPGKLSI